MVGYTDWIDKNANDLLRGNNRELVRRFEDDI